MKKETKDKIADKLNVDEKQKNYLKNYFLLFILFGSCIFLTIYFCKWYNVYKDYEREIPVIRDSLTEITPIDLEHFVIDTPETIIYMCTANDDTCRSFENDFKKYVKRNDLSESIVYLNLTGVDIDSFINEFNQKYKYKIKLNGHYPAFVAFEDGKVISILQGSKNKKVTISKLQNFLELNLYEEDEEEEMSNSDVVEVKEA